jgi:hypothetical protein
MKLIKTLPAMFALALLAGCASQQCDDATGAEAKEGSCCKAGAAKAGCCEGAKTEAAKTEEKPAQKN